MTLFLFAATGLAAQSVKPDSSKVVEAKSKVEVPLKKEAGVVTNCGKKAKNEKKNCKTNKTIECAFLSKHHSMMNL